MFCVSHPQILTPTGRFAPLMLGKPPPLCVEVLMARRYPQYKIPPRTSWASMRRQECNGDRFTLVLTLNGREVVSVDYTYEQAVAAQEWWKRRGQKAIAFRQ